jgi:hypothetical protein
MNHSQTERDTHSHLIIPLTRIRAVYRTHVQACWVLDPDPANTSLGCDSSEQIFSDFNRTDFRHANLWPAEQAPCRREPSMWQWPASEALPARRSWPWQHSCCWASEICARAHRGIGKQMRLLIVFCTRRLRTRWSKRILLSLYRAHSCRFNARAVR